jgi:hypothetical protein
MKNNFIVSCYCIKPSYYGVLKDSPWEEFEIDNLPDYINDGYNILLKRLLDFKNLKRPLTLYEERELEFMLSSLIHAKNSLYK